MNKLSGFAILLFTVFLLSVYSTTYIKKASAISFGTGPCPSGEARDYIGICFPVKECKASLFARPGTCTVTTSPTSSKESNNAGNTQENSNARENSNAGNGATSEERNNTSAKQEQELQQKTIMLPSTTVHLNKMEKIQQSQPGSLLCPTCSSKPVKVESAPTSKPQSVTSKLYEWHHGHSDWSPRLSQSESQRLLQTQTPPTAPNVGSLLNPGGLHFTIPTTTQGHTGVAHVKQGTGVVPLKLNALSDEERDKMLATMKKGDCIRFEDSEMCKH